jgi:hypothetical protein
VPANKCGFALFEYLRQNHRLCDRTRFYKSMINNAVDLDLCITPMNRRQQGLLFSAQFFI